MCWLASRWLVKCHNPGLWLANIRSKSRGCPWALSLNTQTLSYPLSPLKLSSLPQTEFKTFEQLCKKLCQQQEVKLRNNNNRLYLPFWCSFDRGQGNIAILLILIFQNIIGFLISNTAEQMLVCSFYNQWRILINSAMIGDSGIRLATKE